MSEVVYDTEFIDKDQFAKIRGNFTDIPAEVEELVKSANSTDVIALNLSVRSPAKIESAEIVKGGDIVPFMLSEFEKEGVKQNQIDEAFCKLV